MKKLDKRNPMEQPGLLFLAEAYEKGIVSDRESLSILSIRETRKRTGYLLTTSKCLIFLYKSSSWLEALLEVVTSYSTSEHGYDVCCIVDGDEEDAIEIQIDENEPRIWLSSKKFGGGQVMESVSPSIGNGSSLTRKQRSLRVKE